MASIKNEKLYQSLENTVLRVSSFYYSPINGISIFLLTCNAREYRMIPYI
jgi:hypothetical protein